MFLPDSWKAPLIPAIALAALTPGIAIAPGRDVLPPQTPARPDAQDPHPGRKEPKANAPSRIVTSADDRGFARSLAVTARTSKTKYQQLEPVVVEVEIKNVHPEGRDLIVLSHLYWHRRVKAYWRDEVGIDRGPAPETNYFKLKMHLPVGGGAGGSSLKSSAVDRDKLVANLVNDMTAPGEYTIVVEVDLGYYDEAMKWTPVTAHSNAVKVKVSRGPTAPNL